MSVNTAEFIVHFKIEHSQRFYSVLSLFSFIISEYAILTLIETALLTVSEL